MLQTLSRKLHRKFRVLRGIGNLLFCLQLAWQFTSALERSQVLTELACMEFCGAAGDVVSLKNPRSKSQQISLFQLGNLESGLACTVCITRIVLPKPEPF